MGIENRSIADTIMNTTKSFLDYQFDIGITKTSEIKIAIQDDTAFLRLKGLISKAEKELSKNIKGQDLIRQVYYRLFDNSSIILKSMLRNSTGREVRNIKVEIEPEYSELMLIIHFNENIS